MVVHSMFATRHISLSLCGCLHNLADLIGSISCLDSAILLLIVVVVLGLGRTPE